MSPGSGRLTVEEESDREGLEVIPREEPVKRVRMRDIVFDGDRSSAIEEKMRGESRPGRKRGKWLLRVLAWGFESLKLHNSGLL